MKPFAATLLSLAVLLCGQTPGADTKPPAIKLPAAVQEISPAQLEGYLAEHQDAMIIDVRTEDERRTRGHILHSRNHDYFHGKQALDSLSQLDKNKPCVLYCAMGGRARLMAVELHKLGFQKILLLKGGFNTWVAEGHTVAR